MYTYLLQCWILLINFTNFCNKSRRDIFTYLKIIFINFFVRYALPCYATAFLLAKLSPEIKDTLHVRDLGKRFRYIRLSFVISHVRHFWRGIKRQNFVFVIFNGHVFFAASQIVSLLYFVSRKVIFQRVLLTYLCHTLTCVNITLRTLSTCFISTLCNFCYSARCCQR